MRAVRSLVIVVCLIGGGLEASAARGRFDGWVGVEPRRWPAAPQERSVAAPSAAGGCVRDLAEAGVEASASPAPADNSSCTIETPVRLRAISTAQGAVRIAGEPLVACAFAARFGGFVREIAAPLAKGGAGAALVTIEAGGGYECRPRNRVAGAKMSAHGRGLAVDIAGFRLADGRRVPVASARGDAFVAGLRAAACGYFTTVLGPGADAAHADHLHLDLEPHGSSGMARLCQ